MGFIANEMNKLFVGLEYYFWVIMNYLVVEFTVGFFWDSSEEQEICSYISD